MYVVIFEQGPKLVSRIKVDSEGDGRKMVKQIKTEGRNASIVFVDSEGREIPLGSGIPGEY